MPDQLKIHSGERVDLVDYVQGSNTYTQENQKFLLERAMLDRRARLLDGFRIRVEDQVANPGMITVYNGNAVDRAGQLINNESSPADSRSITLLGANLNFYVEIEFLLNESTTDARFFWDPTTPNVAPEPDGSEFSINAATRLTPDWRIVNPVSTTGFEQSTNANSIRVPVGVFRTDASNQISTGATNPGLTLVRAASVLEADTLTGAATIRVIDARIFPATLPFNITLDVGGASPEARTVSAVDRDNGILTLSVNTASDHSAGAIVQVTSGTADLAQEQSDPNAANPLASPPEHPDLAQRMWQANEVRGSALVQSKEAYGDRDDLNVRSLKDHIDFLSAQIRELKFGHARPEVVSTAPPTTFATRPRWFDSAGSVAGARSNSVSIGNGTTTFGDFNGTDGSAVLTAALAALPAGGTIYVKAGTYSFASSVTISQAVVIVGEHYNSTVFSNTNAAGAAIIAAANVRFLNMSLQVGGGGAVNVIDVTSAVTVNMDYCVFTGQVRLVNVNLGMAATNTTFNASGTNPIFLGTTVTATLASSVFTNCYLTTTATIFNCAVSNVRSDRCIFTAATVLVPLNGACNINRFLVRSSLFNVAFCVVAPNTVTGSITGLVLDSNRINSVALGSSQAIMYLANTGTIDRVSVRNNYINITGGATAAVTPGYVVFLENNSTSTNFIFENNHIDTLVGSFIVGLSLDQDAFLGRAAVSNNYFYRCMEMVRLGGSVGTLSSGHVEISGNIHDNASEHNDVYGIRLMSNGRLDRLVCDGNTFTNYNLAGVGVRCGIDVSTTDTGINFEVVVRNCEFNTMVGTGSCYGVLYSVNTGSAMQHHFYIEGNNFNNISGDTISAGVYLDNAGAASNMVAKITTNRMATIGNSGSVVAAYGMYVGHFGSTAVVSSVSIVDNVISSVRSATGVSPGAGIYLKETSNATILGNQILAVRAANVGVNTCGTSIHCDYATAAHNVIVANNYIDQAVSGVANESKFCVIFNSSNTLTNVKVANNLCRTSASAASGSHTIWFVPAGGTCVNIDIDGNTIYDRTIATITSTIYVAVENLSHTVKVQNNLIEQTTYDTNNTTCVGIMFYNTSVDAASVVSAVGNILYGPKAGAPLLSAITRVGIWFRGRMTRTLASSNHVDWNETGVLQGCGIRYASDIVGGVAYPGHLCVGNHIRGTTFGGTGYGEIEIDTATFVSGFAVSNQVGQGPGAVGYINPAVAAGSWSYGAAEIAANNLNKLS